MKELKENDGLRAEMSCKAADSAVKYFGLDRMADDYLKWYEEIISRELQRAQKPYSNVGS
jgi:glycosyltransferase involved in cell wall biosynthesis